MNLKRAELSACDNAASFLQSGFWGAFKARFGWEALSFKVSWKGCEVNSPLTVQPLLVLRRSMAAGFPGGRGPSLAYIPWGPELPSCYANDSAGELRGTAIKELALALRDFLPGDTVFIRFDPPWYSEGADTAAPSLPPPFIRSGADIQPPDTVLIDLAQSMDLIFEQMKPKWRYNARLALKKGVTVRRAAAEETGVFYKLLKETALRDGIAIHNLEYYQTLISDSSSLISHSQTHVNLYLAEHEGDVLAGIVTLFRGREGVYLYGASSDKKRNLMAPYALQVKAMEDAKAYGCGVYDLFGIPPDNDSSHPMAGLYQFKTGFGGKIIHRPGSWDYPCRPFIYSLFRKAETLRKNLRTIKKKIVRR